MGFSFVGFSSTIQILCRHAEVCTTRHSCSVRNHTNPEDWVLSGVGWNHSFMKGIEFCRGLVCFVNKPKPSGTEDEVLVLQVLTNIQP